MNKRRFIDSDNKFDLDLTYICDRLIVMAIPCVDSALYRNDIREVARFFATRHYGLFQRMHPLLLIASGLYIWH